MSDSIEHTIRQELLKVAPAETLSIIVSKAFSGSVEELSDLLDDIQSLQLTNEQLDAVIQVVENNYVTGCSINLPSFLAAIYEKRGISYLATYFRELAEPPRGKMDTETRQIESQISANGAYRTYTFQGEQKTYEVCSFSKNEIGKNLTLLKTPYGCLIFDCGAKCSATGTDLITESELLSFFVATGITVEDILAVVISHAHLDHYGSLSSILNVGIPPQKVFISKINRELISCVAHDIPSLNSFLPVAAFFSPGNKIKIQAFPNGHILGSEGFVISFDNINVIYSGDYCLHDQKTIQGLNPRTVLMMEPVKANGVDMLITETTYGQRPSRIPYQDMLKVFEHFVEKLVQNGYKIFIPSFAIGRSQEVALLLNEKYSILIDGLAIRLSKVYDQILPQQIFNRNTRYSVQSSNKSENFDSNDIVIASSGMLTLNSTSYNYLKELLGDDRKVAIIKTGYISSESYGTGLLDEWKDQSNQFFDISLSAHADENEILEFIEALSPKCICTIHGAGLLGVKGIGYLIELPVRDGTAPVAMIAESVEDEAPSLVALSEDQVIADAEKKAEELSSAVLIKIGLSDPTIYHFVEKLAKYTDASAENTFSQIRLDFKSLFDTLRLYPANKPLCDVYRLTKTDQDVVELSRTLLKSMDRNK